MLYGRSDEDALTPYQPFVEMLGARVPARRRLGGERYRLFEAVVAALAQLPGRCVLVCDDLQWADRPTLLLLRHLARAADARAAAVPRHLPRRRARPDAPLRRR